MKIIIDIETDGKCSFDVIETKVSDLSVRISNINMMLMQKPNLYEIVARAIYAHQLDMLQSCINASPRRFDEIERIATLAKTVDNGFVSLLDAAGYSQEARLGTTLYKAGQPDPGPYPIGGAMSVLPKLADIEKMTVMGDIAAGAPVQTEEDGEGERIANPIIKDREFPL